MQSAPNQLILIAMATISLFAGCTRAEDGISESDAALRVERGASGGALLYATGGCGGVCVLSYPDGKLAGSITVSGEVDGDCSDASGNVFVTNRDQVLEYSYGGTSPVATLSLPGDYASGCSVDPLNNLAVVFSGTGANIAVFANEKGVPATYETHIISFYCGYDSAGDLFVSGTSNAQPSLAELPKGASSFKALAIESKVGGPGQVQWDGTYMTFEGRNTRHILVSRLDTSGSVAKVVGTTRIKGTVVNAYQSWIYGNQIIVPYSTGGQKVNKIGVWQYPQGGKPSIKFGKFGQSKYSKFAGVTLSLPPS